MEPRFSFFKMRPTAAFLVVLLVVLPHIAVVAAQESANTTATAPTLIQQLLVSFDPPNEVLFLLFPRSILVAQTALAVRYFLLISAVGHDLTAACHPVILSFFGTKDEIPAAFCTPEENAITNAYFGYRVLESQFPEEAAPYGRFLARLGLDPYNRSTDTSTKNGWANVFAARMLTYFDNDGWNAQGDKTRDDFRRKYSDSSFYMPRNPAFLPPSKLRRPLRWQPLTVQLDQKGYFASQIHVVPHIGSQAKPLVLSPRELRAKRAPSPYRTPNRKRSLGAEDEKTVRRAIKKLLRRSVKLTTKKLALVHWWENKFLSLGVIVPYYIGVLQLDSLQANRLFLGEMLAQHDAMVLAWKEKTAHDLVRPTTMMRRLLAGRKIRAYRGFKKGVGMVKAEEWEPAVPVQPHSEYPSASAVLCKVSADQLELALRDMLGNASTGIPPLVQTIAPMGQPLSAPGTPVDVPVSVRFETLQEAARSCGTSRLDGGVHFEAAVAAGRRLADGVGEKAYQHVKDLYQGRVPEGCERCIHAETK
ncbi:unnamed protein product [Chondrus crispus]|uniref:Uncharacterized protein n=1 Tax=Chondrus crispus TaxID=2769 RepID=R7QBK3_CHOCR|nr:unnamed protein product [Chondrus crispus]CDF35158.1 unnamed protein product [Chondrus crispus]|eukprot:XP_005714977.1 unnamed protein product [Chondrus crispus]